MKREKNFRRKKKRENMQGVAVLKQIPYGVGTNLLSSQLYRLGAGLMKN